MKLTIDCRFIGKSGIGTYIENVVEAMIRLYPDNEYLLVVEKVLPQYGGMANVCQMVTDIKPFTIRELLCFPTKEINHTDVFFSPYINIPFGIRVPVYSTIHDVIFWDKPELVSKVGLWMRTFFVKHAMWASKGVFTVSEFSKGRITHHFNCKKPITVVPNGVASHIRDYNGSVAKEDYILFVGNVKEHKGLDVLVAAYQEARKMGLTSTLTIVGNKDNFRTSANAFLAEALNDDSIVFTGRLSNEDLVETIAKAKVLVLPSFYEGFGIPPMEALYVGTDAIVSDIEVLNEIYRDLPVTFFKCGDRHDLADKLLNHNTVDFKQQDIKELIDRLYSYEKAARMVMDVIGGK